LVFSKKGRSEGLDLKNEPRLTGEEHSMQMLKKEWKAILFSVWLAGITIFLIYMNNQLIQMKYKNTKMASTIDSIESVVISTDASVVDSAKKIDSVESNVAFIVQKVRRR
jgi:hypothetical protein